MSRASRCAAGKRRDRAAEPARTSTDLLLRASRVFEGLLTSITIRMEDAGGLKRWMYRTFIGVAKRHGEAILEGRPVPLSGRLAYALGRFFLYAPLKNALGFSRIRVAYTPARRSGRTSSPSSAPRHQPEAALRPDRSLPVCDRAEGWRRARRHVGPAAPRVDIRLSDAGEVLFARPACSRATISTPRRRRRR